MKVSIIICFYRRVQHLKSCLDALIGSPSSFDEVVVTDDGSPPDVVEKAKAIFREYGFPIRYAWQPNIGFRAAAARNSGVRHATGDYLVFLDCDFLLMPDALAVHRREAKKGRFLSGQFKYLDEHSTRALMADGVANTDIVSLYENLPEDDLIRDHRKFTSRSWRIRLKLASPKKQTLGGHFSIFREDLLSVNGFDENFVGWGGEDIDLGIRLAMKGIHGRSVIRSARVLHMWHPREINNDAWQTGPNIAYQQRDDLQAVCINGIVKPNHSTERQ